MPWLVTTSVPLLIAPAFLIATCLVCGAVGRRILEWIGVTGAAPLLVAPMAFILGAGVLQFVPFGLGICGLLSIESLRWAAVAVSCLSAFDVLAIIRRIGPTLAEVRFRQAPRWLMGTALLTCIVLATSFLVASVPTLDADGLGYHLTVPKRWLAMGSLGYLPTYPYSNTPMAMEMLFMWAMSIAGDSAAKLVHFAFGLSGVVASYHVGKLLHGRLLAWGGVVLYLCGPTGVGALLGWAYVEGAASAALIVSLLAWLLWYRERHLVWSAVAWLCAGLAGSTKLTAGLVPLALLVFTVLLLRQEKLNRFAMLRELATAPLAALPVIPWMIRSWSVTGNPVFPLFAQWIPSRDFSPVLSAQFEQYNRYMLWGISVGSSWDLATRKAILMAVAAAVVLIGIVLYRMQPTSVRKLVVGVLSGVVVLQLGAAGLYLRYWAPLVAVAQLVAIGLLAPWTGRRWAVPTLLALSVVGTVAQVRKTLGSVGGDTAGLLATVVGATDQAEFLRKHHILYPLYEYVNEHLEDQSGIALIQYCGAFFIDSRTFCADMVQDSLRYTDWDTFVSDLKRLRITHVISPRAWAIPGRPAPPVTADVTALMRSAEHEQMSRLLSQHAKLLASAADQSLYALDLGSLP